MILTNKENYKPLDLDAREVHDIKDHDNFTKVLMKDGSLHLVDEKKFHIKTLIMVELISNVQELRNEKV